MCVVAFGREVPALIAAYVVGCLGLGRGGPGGQGLGLFGKFSMVPTFLTLVSTMSFMI